ncbi:MAG: peptide chain release factor N(5)-glutamine methyltransferase [Erythrobacter sp.]|uniref:peptide chain release factor N(5)-glutamine methyltransferase n=1 Tax=Erythrobacter sp. TaxID=1042 RepID=UPI002604F0EC|nr:peptide chain release factor N(5)-glutamine methyltransferase [Erythrobacter sp.]MDJ0979453.1 peptide chain release factor N(5)-glutamine methyltransferase [Erythrobacter sp.]
MRVADAICEAAQRLSKTSDTARLDAEVLMAHALGMPRSEMLLRHLDESAPERFASWVERRSEHEPIAYIVGQQEFFGRPFKVSRDTLIPRADSETVVEAALEALSRIEARGVLDLGTGTGALLLTLLAERPDLEGVGIDKCEAALRVARANAAALDIGDRARFLHRAWSGPVGEGGQSWFSDLGPCDFIIANPPYVEERAKLDPSVRAFEPRDALFAGPDGLDDYRVLIPAIAEMGCRAAVLEIGCAQAEPVSELAEKAGFRVALRRDLANRPRALVLS